jgi:5-methylcytosine-specific restriction endonuclease McrA
MPFMKKVNGKSVRDYKRENELYNSKPEQIKARSERTTLRREANAKGITSKGDGKDLDHIKPLSKGGANTLSNARSVTKSANRSFSRNADGSLKSQTSKAERKKK